MTDTAVAPEQTDSTPAKVVPDVSALPPLAMALLTGARDKYSEIVKIAETQNKVGDRGQLVSEAVKNSDNPEVVAINKKLEKANELILKLQKDAEALVIPTLDIPSEEKLAEMDKQYKELATELNTFNNVFTGETKKDHPNLSIFDYLGELPKGKRGAKSGQGTGTSRPRVSSVEYTHDVNGNEGWTKVGSNNDKGEFKSSFSHLVQQIKKDTGADVSASDLHEAWKAQNGNVADWTDLPENSTFIYKVYNADQKEFTYNVRVQK